MLAIKTIIRPIFGFASGTFLGLTSMLYMNDIVYSIFKQKLISPIYRQYGKTKQFSTDSVKNISYITAKGSLDTFNQVKPHAIDRSNVKKIFIDDKDYSQPQDHYFSFIRRRKQAKLDQLQQNQKSFGTQIWSQKHEKEDYQTLKKSGIHQVFGQTLNLDGRKDLDAIGERYIQQQRKQEDLDAISQRNKKLESSQSKSLSKQNQNKLLAQYINPQNEKNLAMNSGLFKLQQSKKTMNKQKQQPPLQSSPQNISSIMAQQAAHQKKLAQQGKKIKQIGNIPSFTESMLNDFMKNPSQIKSENEIIRRVKGGSPFGQTLHNHERSKAPGVRTSEQFMPKMDDMTTDLRQINFQDKKRLLKLASKARE